MRDVQITISVIIFPVERRKENDIIDAPTIEVKIFVRVRK
jgi:hypothetical protein